MSTWAEKWQGETTGGSVYGTWDIKVSNVTLELAGAGTAAVDPPGDTAAWLSPPWRDVRLWKRARAATHLRCSCSR
jgi:hypothetical protein